jgi:hypothetical protein
VGKSDTTKMRFNEDKFYDEKCLYTKGIVYDVPNDKVDRWIKRGGELVEETLAGVGDSPVVLASGNFKEIDKEPDQQPHEDLDGDLETVEDEKEVDHRKGKGHAKGKGRK